MTEDWQCLRWNDLDEVAPRGSIVPTTEPIPDTTAYLTRAEFLTKVQAGEIMQLNPKTIERLVSRGELPGYKPLRAYSLSPHCVGVLASAVRRGTVMVAGF